MKLLFTFILAFVTCAGNAQDLLIPSKNTVEKKWIKNSDYQMAWYALKDTTKYEMGQVTTRIYADKTNLTVTTQVSMKNMKAPWIDSTVAEIKTLKPVRHASYNMQRDMVLDFGKIVTGFYKDKMKKTETIVNDTTDREYFDSNLYPVLIGWLPLKDGYRQEISIYDHNPSSKTGVLKATIKDVKSGIYQSDKKGQRNVWIVTVTDEIANGETMYYFDKTDRKLWRQDIDANGRKMMMKLIE